MNKVAEYLVKAEKPLKSWTKKDWESALKHYIKSRLVHDLVKRDGKDQSINQLPIVQKAVDKFMKTVKSIPYKKNDMDSTKKYLSLFVKAIEREFPNSKPRSEIIKKLETYPVEKNWE